MEITSAQYIQIEDEETNTIKATVDGKQSKEIETLRKYSSFNYPMTVMFFNELEDGEHTLELEILPNQM